MGEISTTTEESLSRNVSPMKYKLRSFSAKRDFPEGCADGPIDPAELNPSIYVEPRAVVALTQVLLDHASQFEDRSMHKKYPRRRISASRDFPLGCGRNSLLDITQECQKSIENSVREPEETIMSRFDLKSHSLSKNIYSSGAKLGMEPVKFNKDTSPKRQFPGNSVGESQSQREKHVELEPSNDRKVVQALMASENCPWRQGTRTFKSPTSLTQETMNIKKAKKHEFIMVQDYSKSISRKTHSKKKMFSTRRVAYQVAGQLALIAGDADREAGVTRNKVRETLRLFQAIFRKLLQDEEAKSKEVKLFKRVDLISATILKEKSKWVNSGKQILGLVPGVEVGDEFHYRVELAIIGLHHPFQGGIDYLKTGTKILATSIVASGGYDDDMDSSDVLVYSGQGGNPTRGVKKIEDQKLERGNLALKNSIDERTPVRVIRGFKEMAGIDSLDAKNKLLSTYTYDGLYLVEKYWQEKGRYDTNVFMFQLRRIPGQPELALKEVKKSKKTRLREGLCVNDISHGKEKMPISAVNAIDDEKPPPFEYITKMMHPRWYDPTPHRGCECIYACSNSVKCLCTFKNGGEIPFNHDGAIVEVKPLVHECGPSCKCPPSCPNRVSQHGIKFQLEIFKTKSRGWGVRSLTSIPSGSFICEYTGELLQDKEAEQRTGNDEYLFDIGHKYNDHALWEELSDLIPLDLKSSSSCEIVENVGFTIDAAQFGSVGRFINHSCSPNLYAQNVLYDHDDKRMPHIMLFAAENIPPLQELTYHYNYKLDQVHDSDGNIKKKNCYCGSLQCIGRMY